MGENRVSLRDRMYNLFTKTTLYRLFSTEATGSGSGNTESHDSVESVHDVVHNVAGGPSGGHMYYLDYSAFDPVFWFHHCNIDRYGAMFQLIQPNSYVESGAQTQDNFQWSAGQIKNWYTPLKPFTSNTAGDFWFPQTVKSTFTFNYYYPETPSSATAATVKAAVNSLYGPSSPSNKKRDMRLAVRASDYEGHALAAGDQDYTAHVKCDKFSVGGSYATHFYLAGSNSTNSTVSLGSSHNSTSLNSTSGYTYVGMSAVLAPKEKMDQYALVSSQVPLTTCLQGKYLSGELSSLDKDTVTAYLAKNLHWEVVKSGGEIIPASDVGSFDVKVSSTEVLSAGGGDEFPTYGETVYHPAVTSGKPGGSDTSDDGSVPSGAVPSLGGSGEEGTCEAAVEYQYVDENGAPLYGSMGSKL